jgi:acyl transferase domain-containing protein
MTAPLTPLRKATLVIKHLRQRLEQMEATAREPIAVIGLACRFPGAEGANAFWTLLERGDDATREVPPERWDVDAFYDPTPGTPGKMYCKRGGFIDCVDQFDPQFFRIAPREAIGIDPQQRLLLETCWLALEHAGLVPAKLVGSDTGVFLGISTNDYGQVLSRTAESSSNNAQAGAGNAASVASGRISYSFGFQGPCIAVDTACSSSLVATHLAVNALRNQECRISLVAGVNLMLAPEITINFCQGRMLSPDGRCKTFDANADGYARGEGCGVLVLKRLSDARADGDRVLAVIRGSAVNQDGRSSGLTAPNGRAQKAVIEKALANAGLEPDRAWRPDRDASPGRGFRARARSRWAALDWIGEIQYRPSGGRRRRFGDDQSRVGSVPPPDPRQLPFPHLESAYSGRRFPLRNSDPNTRLASYRQSTYSRRQLIWL